MKQSLSIALLTLSISVILLSSSYAEATGVPRPEGPARQAPDTAITATRVIGDVTEIDSTARRIIVKTEAGNIVAVLLSGSTSLLRLPPGETSLEKAARIEIAEISVGDKAYARGRVSDDRKSVAPERLIVISKAEIQRKQERERAEWQSRGIAGVIAALNPQTREITLHLGGAGVARSVVVTASDGVQFRRYLPDSVKFSDAKPGSFAELRVGDQLRALVEKGADATRFKAEQIVSGSFRTIGGTVTAVSPQTGQIEIAMLGSKQPLTVIVNSNSMMRRITPQVAVMIAQKGQAQKQASPGGQAGLQDVLEGLPALTLSEIKRGDVIAVSSAIGADPSRLTAITLVTGVDAILNAMKKPGARTVPLVLSTGLPAGVLDFTIGQP